MKLVFAGAAWEDFLHWQSAAPNVLERLNDLIKECQCMPCKGLGKPEPLKGDLKAWWSRRITWEDRLVYRISGSPPHQQLEIAQCRFHYLGLPVFAEQTAEALRFDSLGWRAAALLIYGLLN